ncbi:MAG: hypothetical protein PHV32_07675 [Eubacteriales bacterium]|nr:hypothetical protein [Eubacteriales bacterium]
MTKEELKKLSEVDIKTVNKDDLIDINTVTINTDLPIKERVKDYIRQIKNPYCYLDHGVIVKISFSGNKNFEECLRSIVFSDKTLQ